MDIEVKFVEKQVKLDAVDAKVKCCPHCKKKVVANGGRIRFYDGEDFWHYDCYLKFVEEMKRIDMELCPYDELLETDLMDVG